MLRIGLTGDLGSGKSTVAAMFAARGARVFSSDEMARAMMQPGRPVYTRIVARFGKAVLLDDGSLNRQALAKLAFAQGGAEELNAIVHPAVLAEQARLLNELARAEPQAIAVIESALIFTTKHGVGGQPWRERFDEIVLVRAPLDVKVARFVARLSAGKPISAAERSALEQDAGARLALQSAVNESHAAECLLIENSGNLESLRDQVDVVWSRLQQTGQVTG